SAAGRIVIAIAAPSAAISMAFLIVSPPWLPLANVRCCETRRARLGAARRGARATHESRTTPTTVSTTACRPRGDLAFQVERAQRVPSGTSSCFPRTRRGPRGGLSQLAGYGVFPGVAASGRYWARTSDPQLVELVLSQLS